MPTCPKCRHHFRVLEDEDDGQHGCPSCGYGTEPEPTCDYCNGPYESDEDGYTLVSGCGLGYCSAQCSINAQLEDEEGVA